MFGNYVTISYITKGDGAKVMKILKLVSELVLYNYVCVYVQVLNLSSVNIATRYLERLVTETVMHDRTYEMQFNESKGGSCGSHLGQSFHYLTYLCRNQLSLQIKVRCCLCMYFLKICMSNCSSRMVIVFLNTSIHMIERYFNCWLGQSGPKQVLIT